MKTHWFLMQIFTSSDINLKSSNCNDYMPTKLGINKKILKKCYNRFVKSKSYIPDYKVKLNNKYNKINWY